MENWSMESTVTLYSLKIVKAIVPEVHGDVLPILIPAAGVGNGAGAGEVEGGDLVGPLRLHGQQEQS